MNTILVLAFDSIIFIMYIYEFPEKRKTDHLYKQLSLHISSITFHFRVLSPPFMSEAFPNVAVFSALQESSTGTNAAPSQWHTRPTWHSPTQLPSTPSARPQLMVALPPSGGSTSVASSALMSVSIQAQEENIETPTVQMETDRGFSVVPILLKFLGIGIRFSNQ